MRNAAQILIVALAAVFAAARGLAGQVQTQVPPVVPGAKPAAVEQIKVHGTSLEGNLEKDAVDRDVFVFLPPTYEKDKSRRFPVVYANAPLAFMDQYIGSLRQYRAIAIDVGDQDSLRTDTGKFHAALDKYGIANRFEVYPGTHTSKVADRFQNHVLTFFSQNLCFQASCR